MPDHCRAIEAIISTAASETAYSVGSDEEVMIDQIADKIVSAVQEPSSLKSYVGDRPGHDRRYLLHHSKVAREFGWKPDIAVTAGLSDTVGWYGGHQDWSSPNKSDVAATLTSSGGAN